MSIARIDDELWTTARADDLWMSANGLRMTQYEPKNSGEEA